MKLHASGEDYLETILVLQKKLGMVRSVDVARHMEVSKPSVCHAVATLRDGGFRRGQHRKQPQRLDFPFIERKRWQNLSPICASTMKVHWKAKTFAFTVLICRGFLTV